MTTGIPQITRPRQMACRTAKSPAPIAFSEGQPGCQKAGSGPQAEWELPDVSKQQKPPRHALPGG